jgi:hypothetical protein
VAEDLALPRLCLWLPSVLAYCGRWDAGAHLLSQQGPEDRMEAGIGFFFTGLRWMAAYIADVSDDRLRGSQLRRG